MALFAIIFSVIYLDSSQSYMLSETNVAYNAKVHGVSMDTAYAVCKCSGIVNSYNMLKGWVSGRGEQGTTGQTEIRKEWLEEKGECNRQMTGPRMGWKGERPPHSH